FDNSAPHIFLWKLSQKYGSLVYLRFGLKSILVVSSAKMAKEVMKTHDLDFCSRPYRRCSHKLSYNASDVAFSPYNDYWREMRKICVVHLFSGVQQYRPIREDEVDRLIEKISKLPVDAKPVNLSEAIMCLSSTIICRIAFGKRYDEEGAERSRFHELLNESQAIVSSFSFSDYFPYMGWLDRFTGLLDRLEKTFKELDTFYQQLIDEHLDPNRLKPQQEDILDVLLQTWKDHDFSFDLTIDQIKAILMNLFIAGTDTSAATIIWVMSFLMKNPKLQPIAPLLVPRETLRKCNIGGYGYDIPAKTLVYVNAWAIGKDPETWENPEEFYPERFIGSPIDYKGQHFELIPFGAGRRVCPGMHMGVAVVELALANLLYKFDWEMP
ncbi:hypothetical protein Gotri_027416, partial [Gossypium trilobum]|nr:hypothetical protein [Gossypium trilobum]